METEEGGAAWRRWGRSERYSKQWTGYRAQEKGQVDLDKEMSKKKKKEEEEDWESSTTSLEAEGQIKLAADSQHWRKYSKQLAEKLQAGKVRQKDVKERTQT